MKMILAWHDGPSNPAEEFAVAIQHGHFPHVADKSARIFQELSFFPKGYVGFIDHSRFYSQMLNGREDTLHMDAETRNFIEIERALRYVLNMQANVGVEELVKLSPEDRFAYVYLGFFIELVSRNHNCRLKMSKNMTSHAMFVLGSYFGLKNKDCWDRLILDLPSRMFDKEERPLLGVVDHYKYDKKKDVLTVYFNSKQYIHRTTFFPN